MNGQYTHGRVRKTVPEDFPKLNKDLRWADRLEFESLNYTTMNFVEFMTSALPHTPMFTAEANDGRVLFVLGFNLINDGGAFVWLLGTTHMQEAGWDIAKHTRRVFQELRREYRYLRTHALALEPKRNRWLEWMGFKKIHYVEARGRLQLPFIEYETI